MANYLLDTNYLIYLADPNSNSQKKEEVLTELSQKLSDDNNEFFLTPLIRYEVLRGVKWEDKDKLEELKNILAQFKTLDITNEISDLARELYRLDEYNNRTNNEKRNLEKRKFDIFHFATSQQENLVLLSKDNDFSQIEKLYMNLTHLIP